MLLLSVCTPGWRDMVKQNFLTTQMIPHLISFHLPILLCIFLLQWYFVPVEVIQEEVHSGFQSKWNSCSGVELYSWSMKLKTTSPQIEKRRLHVVLSKWRMCIWSATKNCLYKREHLRLNRWCECSMNFILEQHLFWNHSWPVWCKQTIRWQHDSKAWTWNNSSKIQGVTILPSHHASTDTPARASYTL